MKIKIYYRYSLIHTMHTKHTRIEQFQQNDNWCVLVGRIVDDCRPKIMIIKQIIPKYNIVTVVFDRTDNNIVMPSKQRRYILQSKLTFSCKRIVGKRNILY